MKREDLETSGESLVRYKKEPSGCPVCGKVMRAAPQSNAQLTPSHSDESELCPLQLRGKVRGTWTLGCPKLQCPLTRGLVIVIFCCRAGSPVRELRMSVCSVRAFFLVGHHLHLRAPVLTLSLSPQRLCDVSSGRDGSRSPGKWEVLGLNSVCWCWSPLWHL